MNKKTVLAALAACLVAGAAPKLKADDIHGYMIPEYYFNLSSADGSSVDGQHGLWIRRIYLGYNTKISDRFSARVRLEMNSTAFGENTLTPYVKNAHLAYSLGGGAEVLAGIIEPPSFDRIEKFWGLRFIEKTPADFFKLASSRDTGVALNGKTKGGLVYTVMYGNYSSNKGEDNKGKAVYGRLGYESKQVYLEGNATVASDNGTDYTFLSGFGGMKGDWGRLGAGYMQQRKKKDDSDAETVGAISGFAAVNAGKNLEVFARYDHLTDLAFKDIGDYLPVAASQYKARLLMAGLNFKVHKMVSISPNVKMVTYSGENHPKADVWFNLTALVNFKTDI